MGAWPEKVVGTQADMSVGWILNFLLSFAARPPVGETPPAANPLQSEDFIRECVRTEAISAKRRREGEAEEAEQRDSSLTPALSGKLGSETATRKGS